MSTITWSVINMQCYPQKDGETNVVFNVNWQCQAVQDKDGVPYGAVQSGSAACTLDPSAPFTPYGQLTEAQVLGWVFAVINQGEVEAQVVNDLNAILNPPVVQNQLPWYQPPAPTPESVKVEPEAPVEA
jgi:hypothetical protein